MDHNVHFMMDHNLHFDHLREPPLNALTHLRLKNTDMPTLDDGEAKCNERGIGRYYFFTSSRPNCFRVFQPSVLAQVILAFAHLF